MNLLKGMCKPLLAALSVALAFMVCGVGNAAAAQCPPVGNDALCAQLLVVKADGTVNVLVNPSQGPYDGSDDTLVGVQNNSGKAVSKVNVGSPAAQRIFDFDGDGLCNPAAWPSGNQTTPPGCPNSVLGVGFGPTGYEGPGTSFSNISPNKMAGTVNFNPAIKPGGSAYFALEEALTSGQLRASQDGPIPGPIAASGSTVSFQLTCPGASRCAGSARVMVRVIGKKISGNLAGGRGRIVVIGSAPISISAGSTANVLISSNKTGIGLLKAHSGGFQATVGVLAGGVLYTLGSVKLS